MSDHAELRERLANLLNDMPWEDGHEIADALMPLITDAKAEAWDEGWDEGRRIREPACPSDHNPYRDRS